MASSPVLKFLLTIDASPFRRALTAALGDLRGFSTAGGNLFKGFFDPLIESARQAAGQAEKELGKINTKGPGGGGAVGVSAKGGVYAGLAVGLGLLGKEAIGANAEMETFNVQIATLIKGSADFKSKYSGVTDPLKQQALAAEEAKKRMAELNKFGAETPFELPQIAQAEKVLLGFGLTGQRAFDLTGKSASDLRTVIGDVAAGTGVGFDELSVTLGKFSTGATGEAIARLQELGIVTKEELKGAGVEFDKAGSLTSPINKALTATIQIAQDKFGGGMKQLSGTFNGQLSTLADNAKQTLAALGAPLFAVAKQGLGKLLDVFSTSEFQKAIGAVGQTLGAVIGPISDVFSKLLGPLVQLLSPLSGLISSALLPIGSALSTLANILAEALGLILGPLGSALAQLGSLLQSTLTPLLDAATTALRPLLLTVGSLVGTVLSVVSAFIPFIQLALTPAILFVQILGRVMNAVLTPIAKIAQNVSKLVTVFAAQLNPAIAKIMPAINALVTAFADLTGEGIRVIVDVFTQFLPLLGDASDETSVIQDLFVGVGGVVRDIVGTITTIIAGIKSVSSNLRNVKDAVGDGFGKILNGDILGGVSGIFNGISDAVSNVGDDISTSLNEQLIRTNVEDGKAALEDKLKLKSAIDISKNVDQLRKDLSAAGTEAEKNAIAEKIAATVPAAVAKVSLVKDEFGNVTRKIELSNDALDRFKEKSDKAAEGGGEEERSKAQKQILDGLQGQLVLQERAVAKQNELNLALENEKARRGVNSEAAVKAQAAVDEQKKIVEAGTADIAKAVEDIDVSGALKNLAPEAQIQFDNIKGQYASVFNDAEAKKVADAFSQTMSEAATLKADLDANNKIPELIEKFKNAKTEAEKNSLGATIEQQAGIGTIAYDDLGNAIDVNTERVDAFRDANGRSISDKAIANQAKFRDGLKLQAQALADSRDKAKELSDRLNQPQDPAVQKALRAELDKTKSKIGEQTLAIQKTVTEGKKFGTIQGDIRKVGKEFGLSSEQARATATAVGQIKVQAEDASGAIGAMSDEFAELGNAAKQAVENDIGAIALARAKGNLATAEEIRLAEEAAKRLPGDIAAQRRFAEIRKSIALQYGLEERKRSVQNRTFISRYDGETARLRIEAERLSFERRAATIKDANLKELFLSRLARRIQVQEFAQDIKGKEEQIAGAQVALANANQALSAATEADARASAKAQADQAAQALKNLRNSLAAQKVVQSERVLLLDKGIAELEAKFEGNISAALIASNASNFDAETEVFRQNAEALTDTTVSGAEERARALADVEERTFQARIRDLLVKSDTFKRFVDSQAKSEQEAYRVALAAATSAQEAIIAEQKKLDEGPSLTAEEITARLAPLQARLDAALNGVGTAFETARVRVEALRTDFVNAAAIRPEDVQSFKDATDVYNAAVASLTVTQAQLNTAVASGALTQADADAQVAPLIEAAARAEEALSAAGEVARTAAADNRARLAEQLASLGIVDDGVVDTLLRVTRETTAAQEKIAADARKKGRENQRRKDLAQITDIAEQEKAAALFKLEDQLQAELALAEGNVAKQRQLVQKYLEDKAKLERDFAEKSTSLASSGLALFKQFTASLTEVFKDAQDDQAKAAAEALKKEEADLLDSLRRRKISYQQYVDGITAIDAKRNVDVRLSGSIGERVLRALEDTGRKTATTLADGFRGKASESVVKYSQTINLTKEDLDRIGITAEQAAEQSDAAFNEAAINIGAGFALTVADIYLKTKDVGQAVLVASLDALNAMVPFFVAAILGRSLATLGPLGLVEAAGLTALLLGVVGVARASLVKAATGVVDVRGPGTTTSDSIPAMISRRESVITAKGTTTGRNAEILKWVNATGGDIRQWFVTPGGGLEFLRPMLAGLNDPTIFAAIPHTGAGAPTAAKESAADVEAREKRHDERFRAIERAVNRQTTAIQQQKLTARNTVTGGDLAIIIEKGKKVW